MSEIKKNGRIYTPQWIIKEILKNIETKTLWNKKILEPSSGDGNFLVEVVKLFIENFKNKDKNIIAKQLNKNIYAIELSEQEMKKSKKRLNTLLQKNNIPQINWDNIISTDTLFYNFKEKFDYILGNPPYIRIHNLEKEYREKLKLNFITCESGNIDIYYAFFEKCLSLLKKDGILSFITPNNYIKNKSGKVLKEILVKDKNLFNLIDFKHYQVFENATVYSAITTLKNSQNSSIKYQAFNEDNNQIELINNISYENFNWNFNDKKNLSFLNLNKNKTRNFQDVMSIQNGLATLRDNIFITDDFTERENVFFFNNNPIEKELIRPIVKISKNNKKRIAFFPYKQINGKIQSFTEEELKKEYPKAYQYLLKNKEELEKRSYSKSVQWFEYGRTQGLKNMLKEKIILQPIIKNEIIFEKIDAETLCYSGLFIVDFDNETLDILNSENFKKYILLKGKDMSGGYKSINSTIVKKYGI